MSDAELVISDLSMPDAPTAWRSFSLPFRAFQPKRLDASLDAGALTRLGVVAYGRHFHADVAVARVTLSM